MQLNSTRHTFIRKKLLVLFFIVLLVMGRDKIFAQCTILANAVQGISYTYIQDGGTNATSLAYNPALNIYYAVIGGNEGFPLETFNTAGVSLYQTNAGFDSRGMWWNPYANQLQANGFETYGLWAFDLNSNGYALNTGTSLFTGQNQPDAQSCGAYDCSVNEILYFNEGSIYRYSAANDSFLGSYALVGIPEPLSYYNSTSVIFTGCSGNEIGIEDYVDNQIVLFNKTTGAYSGVSSLPGSAVTSSDYHLAYCNNLVWLYDVNARIWTSYSIFSGSPAGGAAVNLGNDTTVCTGQTVILDAGNPGATYQWQDGATTQTYQVTHAGAYAVKVYNGGCSVAFDTIRISYLGGAPPGVGQDTVLCSGESLLLNVTTPGATYLWQDSSTNASYNVSSAGIYTVTISAAGCVGADSVLVTYAAIPVLSLAANTFICVNASVNLDAGNPGATYLWSNGSTSQVTTADSAGVYSVSVSNGGACSAAGSTTVIQNVITAQVSGYGTSCANNDSAIATVSSGTGPFTYLWSNQDTGALITRLPPGIYTVTVTGGGSCFVTASDSLSASIAVTLADSVINTSCGQSNGAISIDELSGNAPFTYAWNDGDTTAQRSALSPGTYTVTVTSAPGCSANISAIINPSGNDTVTVNSSVPIICSNDSAYICAPPGYASYSWNNGQTTACFYTQYAGNYYVQVTDNAGCIATSNHVSLAVYPVPSVSITVSGDTLSCFNDLSCQWYYNGQILTGDTFNIFIAKNSGAYVVVISDSNGCYATSNAVNIVTDVPAMNTYRNLNIFPNPAQDKLTVQWSSNSAGLIKINVFDLTGQRVLTDEKYSITGLNNILLNTENLSGGVYILEMKLSSALLRSNFVIAR